MRNLLLFDTEHSIPARNFAFALLATFWVFMAWRRVGPDRLRQIGALAYDCLIIGLVMVRNGQFLHGPFRGPVVDRDRLRHPLPGAALPQARHGIYHGDVCCLWPSHELDRLGVFLSLLVTLAVVPLMQLAPMTRIIKLLEQLDAANRELDEANKTKTRFISNVSHDLLTPVSSIIGYCGLQPPPIDGYASTPTNSHGKSVQFLERPPPKTSPTKSITKSSILSICCARWRQS